MKTAGITACSNGLKKDRQKMILELGDFIEKSGSSVRMSRCIYEKNGPFSGSGRERAEALMSFYRDSQVTDIFDVSGGDMANEVLPYLDYSLIEKSSAVFWGYSDLTVILNAIYRKTGKSSILFNPLNFVADGVRTLQQSRYFNEEELFLPEVHMVQGEHMKGILVGGNIRCFLKLAGTEYFPDLTDKILLLESRSGSVSQMVTYLSQLQALGAFQKVSGILLGTFCQMEEENCSPGMVSLVRSFAGRDLPLGVTREVGHYKNAKAVRIGGEFRVEK